MVLWRVQYGSLSNQFTVRIIKTRSLSAYTSENQHGTFERFWFPRKKSRWPHILRLQPMAFRKYMASICSLIPLPTTPNLPSVGLFSQTVFGVLRPGRTDCNYTWTTCALHQDCLHWNDPGFLWPPNDCTMRCSTPVVFRSEGCIAGDEETPPVKAMSPRSRIAIYNPTKCWKAQQLWSQRC